MERRIGGRREGWEGRERKIDKISKQYISFIIQ